MSLRITRLPWADKPKHEHGVWHRVISADGQFIGTVRGEGNATLLQNAPRLLAALEQALPYLEKLSDEHDDKGASSAWAAADYEIRRAKGEAL